MAISIANQWTNSYSRNPVAYGADAPPLLPLDTAIANTAGNWLFAFVSWRQDAGTAGTIWSSSSVNITDDAGNFWVPLYAGQHSTGVVRTGVWMAPAARTANFVFMDPVGTSTAGAAPSPYQAAMLINIVEVAGTQCPWYQVSLVDSSFANQGGSVSLSDTIPNTQLALGVLAWDASTSATTTSTGWTALNTVTSTNGSNTTGTMGMAPFYLTGSGASQTLSATGSTRDWAVVIVVVQGATNLLGFPYAAPIENWPALVLEMACGATINSDPLLAQGTTFYTGQNASVAAATWPLWNPWPDYGTVLSGSVKVTPSGSAANSNILAEEDVVSPTTRYNVLAYVYSPTGYSGGTWAAAINWYTSGGSFISTSSGPNVAVLPGEWTQLTFTNAVFPPPTAGKAQLLLGETANTGNVPSTAIFYVGYCELSVSNAYEFTPQDDYAWTDFSSRNISLGSIQISRGIQYEQQSLEAGTMALTLANNDGAMTFGNILSTYWPAIGDTDVPIRLRAVWPGSLTPYYTLFTGYTDEIDFQWDPSSRYGYAHMTASDTWSRMTQQLLDEITQEALYDNPEGYWTCDQSPANVAPNSTLPIAVGTGAFGGIGATHTFQGSGVTVAGNSGASCWLSTPSSTQGLGFNLLIQPPNPDTYFAGAATTGTTVEFFWSPTVVSASQPTGIMAIAGASSGVDPLWVITIDNTAGAANSKASITVYDKVTAVGTTTSLGTFAYYNGTAHATATYYFAVSWTPSSLTVAINPGGGVAPAGSTTVSANMRAEPSAVVIGGPGVNVPTVSAVQAAFPTIAVYGVGLYNAIVPATRLAAHYAAGVTAGNGESDVYRLARIAGYSGFTPPLAMRGLSLPVAPNNDIDTITPASDCAGQVVSSYFTNVSSSTLAGMFVNGAGALQYRRRLEWYNRTLGNWVLGEQETQAINTNTLNTSTSTSPWVAENNSTLTSSSVAGLPLFNPCAVFHGDGVTSAPQISYGSFITAGAPVTAGNWYQFSAWVYSPQGYSTGITLALQYWTAGLVNTGTISTNLTPIPAGAPVYLTTGPFRAANLSTQAFTLVSFSGTPASNIQLFVADAVFTQVNPDILAGAQVAVPEVPYLIDVMLSSDRAQLFNQAALNQYGSSTFTAFQGSGISFQPTSGIQILQLNEPSVTLRGAVPYTATIYLLNTAQTTPYYLGEPSCEDFGNWIVQTLGSPLFRPERVTITPAATPNALTMWLQAEVGDPVMIRKRPFGSATVAFSTYMSKIAHSIDIGQAQWTTGYELSPYPQGSVLQCNDVINGVLTGQNVIGF